MPLHCSEGSRLSARCETLSEWVRFPDTTLEQKEEAGVQGQLAGAADQSAAREPPEGA